MIKRMTLLMLLIATMAMRATAEEWPITIAGVSVNDQNAANIMSLLGSNITPYDQSKNYSLKVEKKESGYTMTLENVRLETTTSEGIHILGGDSVTIWFKGLNYIKGEKYGIWSKTFSSGLLIAGDSYSGCIVKGGQTGIYQRGKYLRTYTVALEIHGDEAALMGSTDVTNLYLGAYINYYYRNFHIRAYATQECVYGFKSIRFSKNPDLTMAHNLSGEFAADDEFGAAFRYNGEVVKGAAYMDYYTKEYIAGKQIMEFELAGYPLSQDGITGTVRRCRVENGYGGTDNYWLLDNATITNEDTEGAGMSLNNSRIMLKGKNYIRSKGKGITDCQHIQDDELSDDAMLYIESGSAGIETDRDRCSLYSSISIDSDGDGMLLYGVGCNVYSPSLTINARGNGIVNNVDLCFETGSGLDIKAGKDGINTTNGVTFNSAATIDAEEAAINGNEEERSVIRKRGSETVRLRGRQYGAVSWVSDLWFGGDNDIAMKGVSMRDLEGNGNSVCLVDEKWKLVKDWVELRPTTVYAVVANHVVHEFNCDQPIKSGYINGSVTFDPLTATLTLDNATITATDLEIGESRRATDLLDKEASATRRHALPRRIADKTEMSTVGIFAGKELKRIVLIGNNIIRSANFGIVSEEADLELTSADGKGKLTIEGKQNEATKSLLKDEGIEIDFDFGLYDGLWDDSDLTISDCTVDIKGFIIGAGSEKSLTIRNASVTVDGIQCGVSAHELVLDKATLSASADEERANAIKLLQDDDGDEGATQNYYSIRGQILELLNDVELLSPENAVVVENKSGFYLRNIDTGKTTGWFTFGLTPENTRYDLTVGSTEVTAANCADIRDAAVKAGKVSYDPETDTLTLDGVTLDCGGNDGIDVQRRGETTIRLVGTSTVKNALTGLKGTAALKLTSDNGKGKLNITAQAFGISAPGVTISQCNADISSEDTGITTFTGGDLTIDRADVTVKGTGEWGGAICYIHDLVLGKGETIDSPVGAQLNPVSGCVELNGETVKEIVFKGTTQGDVNGDGTVDVADIATVISVMAGSVGSGFATSADVNGDGTVDVADIASIISIMAANARRLNTAD